MEHTDSLDDLVAACLERMSVEGRPALDAVCAEHPDHATRLRNRIAKLESTGVVRPAALARIGPYEVVCPLGAGGMGEVFLARQLEPLRREVALKVIKRGMDTDRIVARFEAERQAIAGLNHDGIAKVFDAGTTEDGRPYFAMERVDGVPITEFGHVHGLTLDERVELLANVCDAVQHAHQSGIIHRDLKPSNVLVAGDRDRPMPKIIDFGLAKATEQRLTDASLQTEAGQIVGTPEYMSPEQAGLADRPVDSRTDVYSLGTMLYELVAGTLPFDFAMLRRKGVLAILETLRTAEPPLPSSRVKSCGDVLEEFAASAGIDSVSSLRRRLRGDLDWIAAKALARDPDARYASASELATDLRRHLALQPVLAGPPSTLYELRRFVRRHRLAVGAGVGFVLVLAVALLVTVSLWLVNQRNLELFDSLEVPVTVAELTRLERAGKWPARPEGVAPIEEWLGSLDAVLAQRPLLASRLEYVRDNELVQADGPRFAPRYASFVRSVTSTLELLDDLGAERGLRERVARRLDWARAAGVTAEDEWRAAAVRVRANERYDGVALEPQIGLVPLGPDPQSGLEEFAVRLPGGELPVRDAHGRIAVGARTCPVVVLVPGGPAQAAREPVLAPYFLGKHELTRGQWRLMTLEEPSYVFPEPHQGDDTHPAMAVTWIEADYAVSVWGLALPSEAQWEHACRAGAKSEWWTGDEAGSLQGAANLADVSCQQVAVRFEGSVEWDDGAATTMPVDALRPNAFGLHHMAGNVWEFCADHYTADWRPTRDGDGAVVLDTDTGRRPMRGSSWHSGALDARSATRNSVTLETPHYALGLRIARPLD